MSLDERNAKLEEKLEHNPVDEQIKVLVDQAKRNKRNIRLLAISFIIELLLSLGLLYGWSQNHKLALQAESNHDSIMRNCETSNEARAKNKQLWTYILSLPPSNNGDASTPEQQKRVEDFKVFLDDTFKLRDCSKL